MLDTKKFGTELKKRGFEFYSGVPCSFLKDLINYAINDCLYIGAANEGDAVAIASGAYVGGKKAVVLMQNSGLTNAVSPLTSLNDTFRLPVLGFVSLRGEAGLSDEPQHELTGKTTTTLLDVMNVRWVYLSSRLDEARSQLQEANTYIANNKSFFFVVKKGTFAEEPLLPHTPQTRTAYRNDQAVQDNSPKQQPHPKQQPSRYEALQTIHALKDDDTIQLATTGKTGRELYDIEDSANNLYMVGSMGCVSSFGLGLSLTRPDKKVIIIDGDGSVLMRMGSLATNGYYHPPNMLHILLDNHTHDSTGGQRTVSANVDFVSLATANGYARSVSAHNVRELQREIMNWKNKQQLTFLYLEIAPGSKKELGRPKIKPYEVKERLQILLSDRGNDGWARS